MIEVDFMLDTARVKNIYPREATLALWLCFPDTSRSSIKTDKRTKLFFGMEVFFELPHAVL